MPTLSLTNFNNVCAVLGGFVTLFGLVSYLLKERFYLSESLISTLFGVIFGPHATNWIRPSEYAQHDDSKLDAINLYFTRLVLGIQLVLAGVQLPSRYVVSRWRTLLLLLGPGMTIMWLSSSLIIWGLVPHLNILHALAIGACVTPTDPVLSNSIVKGRFADEHVPSDLQKIVVAESAANDGLGYPFLFLALYLIKYVNSGGQGYEGGAREAMRLWFGETWGYTIIMGAAYGIVIGWIAKELLHQAEERKCVDRESFLVFAIALALFIVGTAGMLGSDDVLACFTAGISFTWDDWFRKETEEDSVQPTIDMLLNIAVFVWFGSVCPWHSFLENEFIPIYRLIFIGVLILLFRRLPFVYLMYPRIPEIEAKRQALFVGFFGPIGVSAIFYLYVSIEFLNHITVDGSENGQIREDAGQLRDQMSIIVWFLTICSIVVHGVGIPLGKVGVQTMRCLTISKEPSTPQSMSAVV